MLTDFVSNRRAVGSWGSPWVVALILLAAGSVSAVTAPARDNPTELTVADIVRHNATARGGSEAWKKLQTMVWAGHTESSNAPERKLPFLLELKRPARMRFEIAAATGKLVRIYDGTSGWKVRPDSNGIPDVQSYTDDELAFARSAHVIDGPLMDLAAKGVELKLLGTDMLDERRAYVIESRLPSGDVGRVWVDAESFLEMRLDREVRMSGGRTAMSTIVFRDYRPFKGLKIPIVVETGSGRGKPTDKLIIEKVALDPEIDDKSFAKPEVGSRRHGGVVVDTRGAARQTQPPAPPPP